MTRIPFTVTQGGWSYSDALYYDIVPDATAVAADAQARFDHWLAQITEPPLLENELPVDEQIAAVVTEVLGGL